MTRQLTRNKKTANATNVHQPDEQQRISRTRVWDVYQTNEPIGCVTNRISLYAVHQMRLRITYGPAGHLAYASNLTHKWCQKKVISTNPATTTKFKPVLFLAKCFGRNEKSSAGN